MGWQLHEDADRWLRWWFLASFPMLVSAFWDCFQSKKKAREIVRTRGAGVSRNEILSVLHGFQFTYDDEARELRGQLVQLVAGKYRKYRCPNCGQTICVPMDERASEYECPDCEVTLCELDSSG